MIKRVLFRVVEVLLVPLSVVSAIWMKILTRVGIHNSALAKRVFLFFGVLPIRDHYYQPLINPRKHLGKPLDEDRHLPGLDFNVAAQLKLLKEFSYNEELKLLPISKDDRNSPLQYFYNNKSFESGDAEYLYNMIRFFKPNKVIEIGSGYASLLISEGLKKNQEEKRTPVYSHICVEPYEQPWLEKTNAKIIRSKAESIELSFYTALDKNDILFIDSSHVIRPQGDVLFEILAILPSLKSGVIVHIHDIFSPKDYLEYWIFEQHKLWNEQYMLEAFLSNNKEYEILGALNFLAHNHRKELNEVCPILSKQKNREPGSFWIRKK